MKGNVSEHFPYVFFGRIQAVRPFDQPDAVCLTELFFDAVQVPALGERLLSAKELHRQIMLDPLILDRRAEGGNV